MYDSKMAWVMREGYFSLFSDLKRKKKRKEKKSEFVEKGIQTQVNIVCITRGLHLITRA